MSATNLLYKKQYAINDAINIIIPTVGEILDNEDEYYNLVSLLTAMPIDMMVQLDDAGIDFTKINDYELFLIMFSGIKGFNTHLIFGDLDLSNFNLFINEENEQVVLYDDQNDITIDRAVHSRIAAALREIHHLEKNRRKPANDEAKEFLLKRAREKMRRNKNRKQASQLEPLIIAMVNTEQFKYDYETVKDLSIYQFNESVRQIIHLVDYKFKMGGVYAGTIDVKSLSRADLDWLNHK